MDSHKLQCVRVLRVSRMILGLAAGASALAITAAHAQTGTAPQSSQEPTPVAQTQSPPAQAPAPTPTPSAEEGSVAQEVIVTGVMASTKAKDANTSFSVLTEDDMSKFTPISADDLPPVIDSDPPMPLWWKRTTAVRPSAGEMLTPSSPPMGEDVDEVAAPSSEMTCR